MNPANPFLGLRTVVYPVPDLEAAKSWYSHILEIEPYFDEPFYAGYNIGGYELGLIPATEAMPPGAAGGIAYWGVTDARDSYERLLASNAQPHSPPMDVGEGILVAAVLDPFGNVFGIIENPYFTAA